MSITPNDQHQDPTWDVAGQEATEVDTDGAARPFRPAKPKSVPGLSIDEIWPAHPTAVWPEGLSLRREDLYEERI